MTCLNAPRRRQPKRSSLTYRNMWISMKTVLTMSSPLWSSWCTKWRVFLESRKTLRRHPFPFVRSYRQCKIIIKSKILVFAIFTSIQICWNVKLPSRAWSNASKHILFGLFLPTLKNLGWPKVYSRPAPKMRACLTSYKKAGISLNGHCKELSVVAGAIKILSPCYLTEVD